MKDSSNSSVDTLCGTEFLPAGEASTGNPLHRSSSFPLEPSISEVTGTSWPPYIFVSDPRPLNLLFADPVPIDPLFSHLYVQYKPHHTLVQYPLANVRSEYLFDLVGQGCNRAGISSWYLGFDNRLFSFAWRNSGEPCVSRYRFTGDIEQKKESIMAHLFTLMKCSEAQISKIYETARDASQAEASVEFLESSKEFFATSNANNAPQYQVTYVKDRWTPLVSFMRDPMIRRFLNHLTVNTYLERSARRDAVKLLKEVDIRYRDKLGSALVNLQVLFDKGVPSTPATSEKAPSEAAHQDIMPTVEEELEENALPLIAAKASSKNKKKKKKNAAKCKTHPTDCVPTQANQSTGNTSKSEIVVTKSASEELSGSLSGLPPANTPSSPIKTTLSDVCDMGNPSLMQHTDIPSTQESVATVPNIDVAGLSVYHTHVAASPSEAGAVGMADMASLEINAEAPPLMERPLSTEDTKGVPLTLPEQTLTVPPSHKSKQSSKAATASKKHDTSGRKKDKAKKRETSVTADSVTKEASPSAPIHASEHVCQKATIGGQGSPATVSSTSVKKASPSAIVSEFDNPSNQDYQKWSDEMDVEEALRQFPNLGCHTEENDNDNKLDAKHAQTSFQDSNDGWTVVKSTPKKAKKAVTEGSPKQETRNAPRKGLCIGTNYRIPQKSGNSHMPTQTSPTANPLGNSTKIETDKSQTLQPEASKPKITVKAHTPVEVLPIPGSSSPEKRSVMVTNRPPSLEFPLDRVVRKSSVEVKLSANVKNDALTSSTATLSDNCHAQKENLEAPLKQASNLVEAPNSGTESLHSAQVVPDIVPVSDLLLEDPPSEVVTSQSTSERVPGILLGVLIKAGVEVSALTSLMEENSTAMLHDNILDKSDNDLDQSSPRLDSTVAPSTPGETNADLDDQVRSISADDSPHNQAMQTPTTPTTPTLWQDKAPSTEQIPTSKENRASKEDHDDGKSPVEEHPLNKDMSTEQPAIDCGEYRGWVTKPTFITWDNKDGYEVLGNRCPAPLTLADHPELNKFLKPGFVFQCAYCQQETTEDMHKETSIVCPGCGPCSDVRYCQKSHLLADTLEHQKVCGTQSGKFPILIHMLPNHYKSLYPYIKPISDSMTPECFRQMAYTVIVKRDREIENPFLAFYNFKMSRKGKKRLADYKQDVYQFQDSGNYYIFSSADGPKGTATLVTLDMIEGGQFFNRARNALFLSNDPKLTHFVYRKIKADVMLHPDKGFRAEALVALDSQFCREFPNFDFSKAGYIGIGRLAYDVDTEWKAIEKIVQKYENTHQILKTWINPPKKLNKSALQTWGTGWTGQPAEEWMSFLNIKYHQQINFFLIHGMTKEQYDIKVKQCFAELAEIYEERRISELEKREAIERQAEETAEIDDQMHEERMKLVRRHLADPAIQEIYRLEDEAKEEREAIARAQYQQ